MQPYIIKIKKKEGIFVKRLLALFLSLALMLGITPALASGALTPGQLGGSPKEFISAASAIMRENWRDDYFARITIKLGENKFEIDGREIKAEPAIIENGELILPILDLAEVMDCEITVYEAIKNAVYRYAKVMREDFDQDFATGSRIINRENKK